MAFDMRSATFQHYNPVMAVGDQSPTKSAEKGNNVFRQSEMLLFPQIHIYSTT